MPIHSHIPCNALWNLNKQGSVPASPLTAVQASSLMERGAEGHRLVKQPFDRPGLLSIEMLAEYEFQPWTLAALSTEVLFRKTAQSDSRPAPDPSLLRQLSFRFQPCSSIAFHYAEHPRFTATETLACYATTVCVTLTTKTLCFFPLCLYTLTKSHEFPDSPGTNRLQMSQVIFIAFQRDHRDVTKNVFGVYSALMDIVYQYLS